MQPINNFSPEITYQADKPTQKDNTIHLMHVLWVRLTSYF